MNFIRNANLPQNRVSHIICTDNAKLVYTLNEFDINCINSPIIQNVDKTISNHSDIGISHLRNNDFIVEKSLDFSIDNANIILTNELLSKKYPKDCLLNSTLINNTAICNLNAIDSKLKEYYINNNINIIDVKQGYSKCNICVVNENSFITSDISIYNRAKDIFDILLIEQGSILLGKYNYGFIGGCSGKIDVDKLAFFGDIKTHKNYDEIKSFLIKKNIEPISLIKGEQLIDVGSIVPIGEY